MPLTQFAAICFAIMPFGLKPDNAGRLIDFDHVYADIVAPAIAKVGLVALRADEERAAGMIHKQMYERLLLSEYAIADLTLANANVFYELGIRHAVRPESSVLLMAEGSALPFDLGPVRSLPYKIGADGRVSDTAAAIEQVVARLRDCMAHRSTDSPLFQLLEGYQPPPIAREKSDVFRERVAVAGDLKAKMAEARKAGKASLAALRDSFGAPATMEAGIAVDLMLSCRAVSDWQAMLDFIDAMDPALARTQMVREQRAFALNRIGRSAEAAAVLEDLLATHGASSEICGLLGRVHKDRWDAARQAGETLAAAGHLKSAIAAYRQGFEADWRDAFPGINLLTLLSLQNPKNPEIAALMPVVRYSVQRRLGTRPDYWDHATRLELAAIAGDDSEALDALADALVVLRESWEAETTARNLSWLVDAREKAGFDVNVLRELVAELQKAAQGQR